MLRGDEEPMISKGSCNRSFGRTCARRMTASKPNRCTWTAYWTARISTCAAHFRRARGAETSHRPTSRTEATTAKTVSRAISRVDVWNRALTAEEVKSYAAEEPSFDAEGLQASYDLLSFADINNAVSSDPIGLRNGVVVDDARQEAGKTPMPTACPPKPDPLSDEELRRCRAACLKGNDSLLCA